MMNPDLSTGRDSNPRNVRFAGVAVRPLWHQCINLVVGPLTHEIKVAAAMPTIELCRVINQFLYFQQPS